MLLGCLELSIDECINKYLSLSQAIFQDNPVDTTRPGASKHAEHQTKPNPVIIEAAMKKILKDCGKEEDKHLEASEAISCKV